MTITAEPIQTQTHTYTYTYMLRITHEYSKHEKLGRNSTLQVPKPPLLITGNFVC